MNEAQVRDAVALVTGEREPQTDAEREKLRQGDALLRAVVKEGVTKGGHRIVDYWPGREPPNRDPNSVTAQQQMVARMILWGWTTTEIASGLDLTKDQVRHEQKALRSKTGERTTWRASLMALLRGWL